MSHDYYDILVIGGGFYGCTVAIEMARHGKRVALFERETDLMQRASYVNQARIHQGYHYPRSILTANRSRINFDRFVKEFNDCVYSEFDQYYAIGKINSKISAKQFHQFCRRIRAPIHQASKEIKALFNPNLIEDIFLVREYAFDAVKLRSIMFSALEYEGVDVALNRSVTRTSIGEKCLEIETAGVDGPGKTAAAYVFNCTYAQINKIMDGAGLPLIPLKHELTEMALVEMPDDLRCSGFTVMDGPYFSIMPFPARSVHSLSHVRYTPHHYWQDRIGKTYMDAYQYLHGIRADSHYLHMLKDAERYIPVLKDCRYLESLWEVKTVLPQCEVDDSRPILFRYSEQLPRLISVMGGKIDNIFDIREKLETLLASGWGTQ